VTSDSSDAALAYSAGRRSRSGAGSAAATTISLAAQATGAQQSADNGAADCVAFNDTALQALATYSDGWLAVSVSIRGVPPVRNSADGFAYQSEWLQTVVQVGRASGGACGGLECAPVPG
jgi:hypothetical protein